MLGPFPHKHSSVSPRCTRILGTRTCCSDQECLAARKTHNSNIFIHVCYAESTCARFLPQEIREKGKLLWSDGKPKKKKNRTKTKKKNAGEIELTKGDGDVGSSTYRLEVTDNGNVVVKRGDSEVVWQALNK